MDREILNNVEARGLSRRLQALPVSGPAGGTDPVLWTLLLRDRPARTAGGQDTGQETRQERPLPVSLVLRAFFAVAARARCVRGP